MPTSLFQQEGSFAVLAQKYNEMQLLRKKTVATVSVRNPVIQSLDIQTAALRADLTKGISHQKR